MCTSFEEIQAQRKREDSDNGSAKLARAENGCKNVGRASSAARDPVKQ